MFEFNNNHIFTGYLKQLLASFNLPKYRVYTRENMRYHEEHKDDLDESKRELNIIETIEALKNKDSYNQHIQYMPYIKNDTIQNYIGTLEGSQIKNLHWVNQGYLANNPNYPQHPHHYEYGMYVPNYTKKLEIKNNIYDSYTHEYLGDYLRFQRDYLSIDLMPLYNCFSNRICNNLKLAFDIEFNIETDIRTEKIEKHIIFNSDDSRYKIYMLPVKLFKEYTIAIDSSTPIEFCCGIFGKYQDNREKFKSIPKLTYQYEDTMHFSQPIIYNKLVDLLEQLAKNKLNAEIAQNEGDLKLFIKVPYNSKSSIVVLEGNYIGWGDYTIENKSRATDNIFRFEKNINYGVTNFEGPVVHELDMMDTKESSSNSDQREGLGDDFIFKPITTLQLLKANTGISYPFADRLVEYLTGNVINNNDYIANDIQRVQTVVSMHGTNNNYPTYYTTVPGAWENRLQPIFYQYINNRYQYDNSSTLIDQNKKIRSDTSINHDILGYVDKDIEVNYLMTDTSNIPHTIANIDIYPEIYLDDKGE